MGDKLSGNVDLKKLMIVLNMSTGLEDTQMGLLDEDSWTIDDARVERMGLALTDLSARGVTDSSNVGYYSRALKYYMLNEKNTNYEIGRLVA
ncbi:hypothetical protein HOA55_04285 [archaeon]|jgi:hypothetical protein|nr:hypothetical protein [archaeon]MBT3577944.1 hypothetical protein [archaeon]MBT6820547.1 hypothetical protein [archaeon]MBT6956085.1 hypothetical protein [archaeon]MBT7025798.1 hypothetical protein [archaeon]